MFHAGNEGETATTINTASELIRTGHSTLRPSMLLGEGSKTSMPREEEIRETSGTFFSQAAPPGAADQLSTGKRFRKGRNDFLHQFMGTALDKDRSKDQIIPALDRDPRQKRFLKASDDFSEMLAKYRQLKPAQMLSHANSEGSFDRADATRDGMSETDFNRGEGRSKREDNDLWSDMPGRGKTPEKNGYHYGRHYSKQLQTTRGHEGSLDTNAGGIRSPGDSERRSDADRVRRDADANLSHLLPTEPSLAASAKHVREYTANRRFRRHVDSSEDELPLADYSELSDYPEQSDYTDSSDQLEFPVDKRFMRGMNPYLRPYLLNAPKKRLLRGFNPYWPSRQSHLYDRTYFSQPYNVPEKHAYNPMNLHMPMFEYNYQNEKQDPADDSEDSDGDEDDEDEDSEDVTPMRLDKRFRKGLNPYLAMYSNRMPIRINPTEDGESEDIVFDKRFLKGPNRYLQLYASRTASNQKYNPLNWHYQKRLKASAPWDIARDPSLLLLDDDGEELDFGSHAVSKRFLRGFNPYLYAHASRGYFRNSQESNTDKRFKATDLYQPQSPPTSQELSLVDENDEDQTVREKRFLRGRNPYFLELHQGKRGMKGIFPYLQSRQLLIDAEPKESEDDNEVSGRVVPWPAEKRFMKGGNKYLHSHSFGSQSSGDTLDRLRQYVGDKLVMEITKPLRTSLDNARPFPSRWSGWELGKGHAGWPALVSRQGYSSFH